MKKIDFHMHTIYTAADAEFVFSLDVLKRYVEDIQLDAIAITNHDLFDREQFETIRDSLEIAVFPGIEINLQEGHLLLISDDENLSDFQAKADAVSEKVRVPTDRITVEELKEIYVDLSRYLLIPHYQKNPSIGSETLSKLSPHIVAGEVSSAKKFISTFKDSSMLTPVLFSDVRIRNNLPKLPTRQTFIDCGDLNINSIKLCLRDRRKVALSKEDGNAVFQIFEDGQKLSTGLNVVLGSRSSGKTHTLNEINSTFKNVHYIEQFALVQQDEVESEREFKKGLKTKRSQFIDSYLLGFKQVLEDVLQIHLDENDREVDDYVTTLLKAAEEADKQDTYSKVALFNESQFPIESSEKLKNVFKATRTLIENVEYRDTIDRYLDLNDLKRLACDLIEHLWQQAEQRKRRELVNSLVKNIRQKLKFKTSAVQLDDTNLYKNALDRRKVTRFNQIVGFLKSEIIIHEQSIQSFTVIARKKAFSGALGVKKTSGTSLAFSGAFRFYEEPYKYLQELMCLGGLPPAEIYRLFCSIEYEILNAEGNTVSGGERSEFRLLQEIKDAQNYDMLLIDEPESSFDNIFLNSNVNQIIRDLSDRMPVVVVTHNSTVGASIGADYVIYADKQANNGQTEFTLYSGRPTDKDLTSVDGKVMSNYVAMMNSLEAGEESYQARMECYETIKN